MKIITGFYFVKWMLARLAKTLLKLPLRIHRSYMKVYKDHWGLGLVAWSLISILAMIPVSAIALGMGKTREESLVNFDRAVTVAMILSVSYFFMCVILDQYEKFDNERMATWRSLKD